MRGEPTELAIRSRRALLDALQALERHRGALVLVGAQAANLHTDELDEPIATQTKDADLVVDPIRLDTHSRIDEALEAAGFHRNLVSGQPGEWLSADGVPVDLLVPAGVAPGNPKRRGVSLPPNDRRAMRRTLGLEAALVDQAPRTIAALERSDTRRFTIAIAGPAALLVAKLQKITERQAQAERRHVAKDGHDIYRLLRDVPTATTARAFEQLLVSEVSATGARAALRQLGTLFRDEEAHGVRLAAAHIAGVGDPATVAEGSVALAEDLLDALGD